MILGTAAYMSPEQAEGKKLDGRSDIFSFGTVLYEMTTGRRPFTGDSTVSILAAVLRENPKPVRELSAAVPAGLARLIHRCLAKHPEKRWQSVADVRLLLQDLEQDDSAAAPEAAPKRTKRALSLRFAIPFGLAAILAGALLSRLFTPASKISRRACAADLRRADVGFRPLLRARHLSRRKAARLCVGPRRRGQSRYLGAPASQRSPGAGDHRQSGRP